MARYWFSYNGYGDPLLPSSYGLTSQELPPVCSYGCKICAIYTPGAGIPSTPLSQNIRMYIATALARQVEQPELPVLTPPAVTFKYVLLRNC